MQKEVKTEITKEKLIAAAEKLIANCDDPFKVTSRQIAEESGMQAAMINYCFSSRENLIYEVFHRYYKAALKDAHVEKILTSNDSPKDKLKKLHYLVAKFLIENHKLTKAITNLVLFERDLSEESVSYGFVKEHFNGTRNDKECRLIAYEMSTMMQLIIYRKDDFKNDMGIDLEKDRELKHYIDMRIDLLLPEATA
ncbi:MAG: TetR/AcrR family transcriptional regulator [Clostridiales bacterium]|nr:TetR/AcrR family transcriptional regulator [Clostridiales bacterium]